VVDHITAEYASRTGLSAQVLEGSVIGASSP
jgi:hypothetical protein